MWMILIVIVTSIWVYVDASRIGVRKDPSSKEFTNMGALGWSMCTLFLWIVGFPLYLAKRGSLKRKFAAIAQQGSNGKSTDDLDSQLRKLAKLRDDGLITQTEYDLKKKEVLG